jgi:hypothetical protein
MERGWRIDRGRSGQGIGVTSVNLTLHKKSVDTIRLYTILNIEGELFYYETMGA